MSDDRSPHPSDPETAARLIAREDTVGAVGGAVMSDDQCESEVPVLLGEIRRVMLCLHLELPQSVAHDTERRVTAAAEGLATLLAASEAARVEAESEEAAALSAVNWYGSEYNIAMRRAQAAERERDQLRGLLVRVMRRPCHGQPCWCEYDPRRTGKGEIHDPTCEAVREALARETP